MSKKVVVVDDDQVTRIMLEKAIGELGVEVFTARDGAEGFDMIQSVEPDLVISDMLIPKIHGIDLCKKIKADELLKETPVVLMSAVYKDVQFRYDIEEAGADSFVEKPIDIEKLRGVVESFLGQKEPGEENF